MFRSYVSIANYCWSQVDGWPWFSKATVGRQLVSSADSIGANIAEGAGRYGQADSIHFFVMARGSAREAEYWLNRCKDRNLLPAEEADERLAELGKAGRLLNSLISYRRETGPGVVRENLGHYGVSGPGDLPEEPDEVRQHSGLSVQDFDNMFNATDWAGGDPRRDV